MVENRFESLQNELKQEIYAKESSITSFSTELEKTVSEINENIKNIDMDRIESYRELLNNFNGEGNKISERFKEERVINDTNKEKLEEIIEELVQKTKNELLQEKKERENNEDILLTMLEGTCSKLETLN